MKIIDMKEEFIVADHVVTVQFENYYGNRGRKPLPTLSRQGMNSASKKIGHI